VQINDGVEAQIGGIVPAGFEVLLTYVSEFSRRIGGQTHRSLWYQPGDPGAPVEAAIDVALVW